MINVYDIWNKLVKGLNSIDPNYRFIKANMVHNLPDYPYITVNCLNPYIRDKDMIRGTITQENIEGDGTKIKVNKTETPQMVFSLNAYSDKLEEVLAVLKDAQDYLSFKGHDYLESNEIVVLECAPISDRTSFLETDYQYKWGFDVKIRVRDVISMEVDTVASVEVNNENIDIGGI